MGEAQLLADLRARVDRRRAAEAVRRALIPQVRLHAPAHPRGARHRRAGHGAHAARRVRRRQLRHRLRGGPHPRRAGRRGRHRRRRAPPGAPVQRLRAPRRDGAARSASRSTRTARACSSARARGCSSSRARRTRSAAARRSRPRSAATACRATPTTSRGRTRTRRGASRAMRAAIERSGLAPDDVDFVNAHGTGTKHNDAAESKVMRDVFGDRRVPISSMKSMLGHCMGAASALEAIGCVFTLETGIYPPTIGYETPDPECDVDVVANVARRGKADVVVNNSLAFGGYNAVAVLRAARRAPARRRRRRARCRRERRARSPASASRSPRSASGAQAFLEAGLRDGASVDARPYADAPASRCPASTRRSTSATRACARSTGSPSCSSSPRASRSTTRGLKTRRRVGGARRREQRRPRRARTRTARSRRSPSSIASRSSRTRATSTRRASRSRSSNSAAGYASIWEELRALNVSVSDGNCGALDAVACADVLLETGARRRAPRRRRRGR